MKEETKQNAINNFLKALSGQTFSDKKDFENYIKEHISAVVEKVYKEELEIADNRWKRNEHCREELETLQVEIFITKNPNEKQAKM